MGRGHVRADGAGGRRHRAAGAHLHAPADDRGRAAQPECCSLAKPASALPRAQPVADAQTVAEGHRVAEGFGFPQGVADPVAQLVALTHADAVRAGDAIAGGFAQPEPQPLGQASLEGRIKR